MAFPSGTFTDPSSGKLQITFSGRLQVFAQGGSPQWGTGSSSRLDILCQAGSAQTILSLASPSNFIELDYVGGTSVACSMSLLGWSYANVGGAQATHLRIRCILMKR